MKRIFVVCRIHDTNLIKTRVNWKIFIIDDVMHELNDLIQMVKQRFDETQINSLFLKNGIEIENINEINENDYLYAEYVEKRVQDNEEWIVLNVGGRMFQTTKSTLISREPESFFSRFLSNANSCSIEHEENGLIVIKINRSGRYFEIILDYLRHGKLIVDVNLSLEGVLEEAQFYSLANLIEMIKKEKLRRQTSQFKTSTKLTRHDVITFLCPTKSENNLRFQSVDLQGADLSKLDLSYINFKYANLSGCNLSGCNLSHSSFEKADLSKTNMKFATCHGVTMIWTNLEYSDLSNSDFEVGVSFHFMLNPHFSTCTIRLSEV